MFITLHLIGIFGLYAVYLFLSRLLLIEVDLSASLKKSLKYLNQLLYLFEISLEICRIGINILRKLIFRQFILAMLN